MEENKVVTVSGNEIDRILCRKINDRYYQIGDPEVENSGDCYKIKGKYVRMNSGFIVYNHTKKKYVRKNSYKNLVKGVVGFNNDVPKLGYFEKNYNAEVYIDGNIYYLLSEDIIVGRMYIERLSDGIYYKYNELEADNFSKIKRPRSEYKRSLSYDSRFILDNYIQDYENNDIKISDLVEKYSSELKGLSFGVEFETTAGFIPERYTKPNGLIPLRDGSITGLEYVTVPLEGAKGLQNLINCSKIISERTETDYNCSMHYHIGNIPRTKEFMLAFYKTIVFLQNDLYELYPLYKKYNFEVKRKNYTKPLPVIPLLGKMDNTITDENIDKNFDILFNFLSSGYSYSSNYSSLDQVKSHPNDPEGRSKWNISSRYCCVNMVPLLFGNKQTVEFRLPTSTNSIDTIINTLFMYSSIVNFVKSNTDKILKDYSYVFNYSLSSIVGNSFTSSNLRRKIQRFIDNRKSYSYLQKSQGSIKGDESMIPDTSTFKWDQQDIISEKGF